MKRFNVMERMFTDDGTPYDKLFPGFTLLNPSYRKWWW
jgi:hypothetical protein